ncbi:MAG: serine/threonine protein kinase [Gemmataceae bacterium]|nr:serine/threonine protein kinase [Gemmataceae bacterium]
MGKIAITSGLLLSLAALAQAEDWPAWRGPTGEGISKETNLPSRWSRDENIRFRTAIPGRGHSSPIIHGDRILLTTCSEGKNERRLLCLDRVSGKILWDKLVLSSPLEKKHSENSFSSATPATDGKSIWLTFMDFPEVRLYSFDMEGKKQWEKNPGKLLSRHGFCSSPVLHKNLVILNCDQDADGFLVAVDKATGKEIWRVDRPNKTRSYCTPVLIRDPKDPSITQLVLSGSKCVTGYDASNGKLLWIIDGPTEQYVASLVFEKNLLFLTTGFPEYHLMGIDPRGRGNVTKTHVAWHIPHKENGPKGASYVPSPLAHDGHFFVVSDVGYLGCVESLTGKRLWLEKLGRKHHASPVYGDGKFYIPDDEGVTWVIRAGNKFEVLAKNPLGEMCYASPAISQGEIFMRTWDALYCISEKGKSAKTGK